MDGLCKGGKVGQKDEVKKKEEKRKEGRLKGQKSLLK